MKFLTIKNILTILLISLSSIVQAQQDPVFTMYYTNMNIINPAYAGTGNGIEFNALVRCQWTGIEGAPSTQAFSISSPIMKNLGGGLSIVNDKVFVTNETDVYIDASYKVKLSEEHDMYFGLKAGGSFFSIDLASLGVNDPLFDENVSRFNPNFGAGVYLKHEKYYASLSVPALLESKRYEKEISVVTAASDKPHIYLGGGYIFDIENSSFISSITPSFMMRYVSGAPVSFDVSATADLLGKLEFGVSHRFEQSFSGLLLFRFTKQYNFKIGYAYEHAINDISKYSNGSHEFVLKASF